MPAPSNRGPGASRRTRPAPPRPAAPCAALPPQVPYFNAPIYLENKTQIGKVEEILGAINNVVRAARARRRAP